MLQSLQTIMSIDDLADVLEIQNVHASWLDAEQKNAEDAAVAARKRNG